MEFCLYLKAQDHAQESPSHSISRTWAKLVISERVGRTIGQNSVQLLVDRSWREVKQMLRDRVSGRQIRWSQATIPAKLPSAEVPGVHFQLPQSPTWRRQHRLTVLGLEFVR